MKEKVLYISDRPAMGADMLIKNLSDTFEITRSRSSDKVDYVPKFILVNLAGLESPEKLAEKLKTFTNAKIFLLGTQAEVDGAKISGAEAFIRPFNANEIRDKLSELSKDAKDFQRMILLVDDDSVMIKTLREGLSTSYKVLPANSGANALKILERFAPDMILLDYEMPEMNGPQVLEAIRNNAKTAKIPVMFLTAKTDAGSIEKIEALEPEGHMLKTLPLKEIKGIIQNFFDNI
ncbi:MAG: response regulator [Synergistaceae bacterium]|nr:response regulator [Synergistaceae bacterium]